MAVVFNFLGVLVMTMLTPKVAETISKMVTFETGTGDEPLIVLSAALFAIVIWATAAWYFGIPTSESHALIAGITGAAMSLGGLGAINFSEWRKVLIGLVISVVLGFVSGWLITKVLCFFFRRVRRQKANRIFGIGQTVSAAAMAFMHGAQDGQKFIGVFLLSFYLNGIIDKTADGGFIIPLQLMVLCSLVMGIGTSVGGFRIIKAVGMDMVKLERYQGFAADLGAAASLLFCTLYGIPVSTTHTKTTAIMGVGAPKRISCINWSIVNEMLLAWVLTFPGCGLIGFFMAKFFSDAFLGLRREANGKHKETGFFDKFIEAVECSYRAATLLDDMLNDYVNVTAKAEASIRWSTRPTRNTTGSTKT
jgi:PiT family inorganic phosphate transporter